MYKKDEKKKVVYPVIKMKDNGRIILPNHLITQINYLHGRVGTKEWSGMLIYDVKSGNPTKPKDFVLEAKDIFLMDIGSGAYTEYEADGDIVDYYDNKPEEYMEYKTGHIHTHHNMNAYFSGTDDDELQDNVDKHNYYLSLIVNFAGKYVAKVAFLSDVHNSSKMNFTNDKGKKEHFKTDSVEKAMVVVEMDIFYDYEDPIFYKRYNSLVEKIAERAKSEKQKAYIPKGTWKWNNKTKSFDTEAEKYRSLPAPGTSLIDADPRNLTNGEVVKLARNLFSVTTDLSEMRSVYAILYQLSDAPEKDIDFYYNWLADNMEIIIENYFDTSLEGDEMKIVLGEVIDSLLRFVHNKKLTEICKGITDVIQQFGLNYYKKSEEEAISEQLEEETLEMEFEDIK